VKAAFALLAVLAASPACAASDAYCARWALVATENSDHPLPNISEVEFQIARHWSICLNSDMDPTSNDTAESVAAATEAAVTGKLVKTASPSATIKPATVKTPTKVATAQKAGAGPGCRRYRSYDQRTHTVLGYNGRRLKC